MAVDYRDLKVHSLRGDAIIGGKQDADGALEYSIVDFVQLSDILNDPRYHNPDPKKTGFAHPGLLQIARGLKNQYPTTALDPSLPDYREQLQKNEQVIVETLSRALHRPEYIGLYNPEVEKALKDGTPLNMVASRHLHMDGTPTKLSEFKANEGYCPQHGGLMNALCYEAGMTTAHLSGFLDSFIKHKDESLTIDQTHHGQNYHLWAVSLLSGNIIEGTESGEAAYRKSVKPLSAADILAGETVLVTNGTGYLAYSTGDVGAESRPHIEHRKKLVETGKADELLVSMWTDNPNEPFNDPRRYMEPLQEPDWPDENGVITRTPSKATQHSLKLAGDYHKEQVIPIYARYEEAIKKGDFVTAKACSEAVILPDRKAEFAVRDYIHTHNKTLDSASIKALMALPPELIARTDNAGYYLGAVLSHAIKTQGVNEQEKLELARFCVREGALDGMRYDYHVDLLFHLDVTKDKLSPHFTKGLAEALGVTPDEYFQQAVKYKWEHHVEAALGMMSKEQREAMRPEIEQAEKTLSGYKSAFSIRRFIQQNFDDNMPEQVLPALPANGDKPLVTTTKTQDETTQTTQTAPTQKQDNSGLTILLGATAGGIMTLLTGGGLAQALLLIACGAAAGLALAASQKASTDPVQASAPAPQSDTPEKHPPAKGKELSAILSTAPVTTTLDTIVVDEKALARADHYAKQHGVQGESSYQSLPALPAQQKSQALT